VKLRAAGEANPGSPIRSGSRLEAPGVDIRQASGKLADCGASSTDTCVVQGKRLVGILETFKIRDGRCR
jgi:hypothetical protein